MLADPVYYLLGAVAMCHKCIYIQEAAPAEGLASGWVVYGEMIQDFGIQLYLFPLSAPMQTVVADSAHRRDGELIWH